ncbi:MAG TPA: sugar phosphate nucleotidyltransferase, partial [Planctomycetota bacterium]|nr:sugar phosphate nucleotidyltransferase [Planctomycetota bacterium]
SLDEKPARTDAALANMGIYLFETGWLADLLRARPVDLVLDVLRPQVAADQRVMAYEFDGYWEDVGTVASYYRASLELLSPSSRLELHDARWPILTRDEERPPVWLGPEARIEDSLVANGCRVEGRVRRSILFAGVHVAPGAEVNESVIMADTRIAEHARVDHAILDKYVRIGAGARVGESAGAPGAPAEGGSAGSGTAEPGAGHEWLAGLSLVGKDTWVPDGGRVLRPSVIGVGGRYEDFAEGVLAAGTVVPNRRWFEVLP